MARPNRTVQRRQALIPIIARAFAELGFRRTTTAELAKRCGVQENVLYRLWPGKKAMFLAAIDHVYALSEEAWAALLADDGSGSDSAERILQYEAGHHGEFGLYRIVFAGLSEADDPEIRDTLKAMYSRFHRFIRRQIAAHRTAGGSTADLTADLSAWAFVGLGTMANISQELGLMTARSRRRLMIEAGRLLLEGRAG